MTDEDPTRTLHHLVARTAAVRSINHYRRGRRQETPETMDERARQQTDPEIRSIYLLAVMLGWGEVFFFCALIPGLVIGFGLRALFGDRAAQIFATIWAVPAFFCVAGMWNAVWRYYWYVPQAKRRARRDGVGSERFEIAMRRTLPPHRSVVSMAVVGLAASVITYLVW